MCRFKKSHQFQTIEISFSNGWDERLSYVIDAEKQYFRNWEWGIIGYGKFPDSVFSTLEACLDTMINHRANRSIKEDCIDCPAFAMRIMDKKDTISVLQSGRIDRSIRPVIEALLEFKPGQEETSISGHLILETDKAVFPPPPPVR